MEKSQINQNSITARELTKVFRFPEEFKNNFSSRDNNLINRLKKNSRPISSRSMTTTIKYEFTISRNNPIKERQIKNDHDTISQSLSNGKVLRTQSRILNNKHDEDGLSLRNEYTYRNRGFENFNMNKVCGSSYHKNKRNIQNKVLKQIGKNNLNDNIKVIKEYKLNYVKDIFDENDNKDLNNEKINSKNNITNGNKYEISKISYYTDKEENTNTNKNYLNKNNLLDNNKGIKLLHESVSEIKNKNKLIKSNKIKYLIHQKGNPDNLPFNIKNKILSINGNESKIKNKNNSNVFLFKNYLNKRKYPEENNKTMDKISSKERFEQWNKFLYENSGVKIYNNKRRNANNINYYNNLANKLKNNTLNYKRYSNERTINLINTYADYKKDKFIMPPNNLKSILLKKENEFFDY